MRVSTTSGLALALLLAGGLAACSGADENAAVPQADEPAQTGSIPADPAAPPTDPMAQPDPLAPADPMTTPPAEPIQ